MQLYKTVVVDPPWTPELGSTWKTRFTDKSRPQKYYKTLSLDEIITYNPPVEKKSHLYLWVLNQHINWGYKVAEAWGFKVIQMLTWCKPGLGTGQFQCNTEHVLVCRKGNRSGNPFGKTGGTYFHWSRGKHSEKPEEFFKLVEKVSPPPYLEMYARRKRDGWSSWGNEIDSNIRIKI